MAFDQNFKRLMVILALGPVPGCASGASQGPAAEPRKAERPAPHATGSVSTATRTSHAREPRTSCDIFPTAVTHEARSGAWVRVAEASVLWRFPDVSSFRECMLDTDESIDEGTLEADLVSQGEGVVASATSLWHLQQLQGCVVAVGGPIQEPAVRSLEVVGGYIYGLTRVARFACPASPKDVCVPRWDTADPEDDNYYCASNYGEKCKVAGADVRIEVAEFSCESEVWRLDLPGVKDLNVRSFPGEFVVDGDGALHTLARVLPPG